LRERGKDGEGEEGKPTQASNSKTAYAKNPSKLKPFLPVLLLIRGPILRILML